MIAKVSYLRNNISEAALHRCSYKTVFWKYVANLHENTYTEVILLKIGTNLITEWGSFDYYKLGQVLLQIGAALLYTKPDQWYYNVGQFLSQIGASITKQGNFYYKVGQLL